MDHGVHSVMDSFKSCFALWFAHHWQPQVSSRKR